MDFLYFYTNYKQDHRLEIALKFVSLVSPTFEKISDFSMYNVYWDTMYYETQGEPRKNNNNKKKKNTFNNNEGANKR